MRSVAERCKEGEEERKRCERGERRRQWDFRGVLEALSESG